MPKRGGSTAMGSRFFGFLIYRNPILRPGDENWPPQKIRAYGEATAVPDFSAKTCYYRMRSEHKRFNKTLYVWRLGFLTLRNTPYFVLRRFVLALLRCAVLAGIAVVGLRLLLKPLGLIDLGFGPALRQESETLFALHSAILRGMDAPQANDAVAGVVQVIWQLVEDGGGTGWFHLLSHLAVAFGIVMAWAALVAFLVGLAVNAVMWLALALWTLVPWSVEDRWLNAMRRHERQHRADLAALAGDVAEAKPVGPTAPHDDEEEPAGPRCRIPRAAFAGVAVVAAAGGAAIFGAWEPPAPTSGAASSPPVSAGPPASLADILARAVPDGFRDPSHWMRDGRGGCLIYHPSPVGDGERVTWSGACVGGFAQGRGVAVWSESGKEAQRDEATLDHGLRDGPAILRFPSGSAYRDRYDHGRRIAREKIAP